MALAKTILTIVFIVICVILTVVVLLQEGKQQGLGSIGGMTDTYWSKNKGRSKEGMLVKATTAMVVLFMVISAILCIGSFK